MYVYIICIYMHIYVYMFVYVYICLYIYKYLYLYMYIHVYIYMDTFSVSRGKPSQALVGMSDPPDRELRAGMILDAIYADADMEHAARLAERVPRRYPRPTAGTSWETVVEGYAGAQYDLVRGGARGGTAASPVLARGTRGRGYHRGAATSLILESVTGCAAGCLAPSFRRLGSARGARFGSPHRSDLWRMAYQCWDLRRLRADRQPYHGAALARARRNGSGARNHTPTGSGIAVARRFCPQIWDEARYAALVGDRDGAIRPTALPHASGRRGAHGATKGGRSQGRASRAPERSHRQMRQRRVSSTREPIDRA